MDLVEEVGESSSPPRSYGSYGGGSGGNDGIRNDVYNRLIENENEEALGNPDFREQLEAHFNRLPPSYGLDINMDRVEDVLLHQSLLALAKDPDNLPVFHIRFLENIFSRADDIDGEQVSSFPSASRPCGRGGNEDGPSLNHGLEVQHIPILPIHEVIFSTIDKPKLLSQLSALLSDIGLNIREAHVFSTTDGYSLDVFVVDGWPVENTEGLYEEMRKSISRSEGTWSGSSHSQSAVEKAIAAQEKCEYWEIDWRSLKIGEKIAAGSCGDLYRGVYHGQNVAVKVLRSEHLNDLLEDEFAKEVSILRIL